MEGHDRTSEIQELIDSAEQQSPGVVELLKVYGGYEEMEISVREYLWATQLEPLVTTSNQTCWEV